MDKIDVTLEKYGYTKAGEYYIKPIKNANGQVVVNAIFSKVNGHFPLRIVANPKVKPKLHWVPSSLRKWIDNDNIEKLCENVEKTAKRFRAMEVDFALSSIE